MEVEAESAAAAVAGAADEGITVGRQHSSVSRAEDDVLRLLLLLLLL